MRKRNLPILKLLLFFLFLLAGLFIFFLWQTSAFGKFDRFNIVVAGSTVQFLSYDRKNKSATVVLFPNDFYISEVLPHYGSYKIPVVYHVGDLDHRGGEVLSWTMAELLGVPVDGFVYRDGKTINSDIKKNFSDPRILWTSKTDLGTIDMIRLALNILSTRFDKIKVIDLANYSQPLVLADTSMATSIDKESLDRVLSGLFNEDSISGERLRVEVVNSSSIVGLGSRAARVLTNLGMTVVNVASQIEPLPICQISTDRLRSHSQTVKRAAGIYSCRVNIKDVSTDRADVSIGLGIDYANRFLKNK